MKAGHKKLIAPIPAGAKTIPGWKGYYAVTAAGQVISLRWNDPGMCVILKQCATSNGYSQVVLRRPGVLQIRAVHRLVAQAFIANPKNKPQVNHKNGIKADNRVDNLEWATAKENAHHCYANGLHPSRKSRTIPLLKSA